MPCTDGGVPHPPTPKELRRRKVPAMLCAVLSTMDSSQLEATLNRIDWKEAGVSREDFAQWWKDHQTDDAIRKKSEAERAQAAKAKAEALSKLTKQDLKALGLNRNGNKL